MDLELKQIDKYTATDFVQKYHYSKILPRITKHYIGVYDGDRLVGAITLGWGTQPLQTIKKIFYKHDVTSKDYLEIGKMCFLPEFNGDKRFGSTVLKLLVKWCKENTDCLFLYTLADGIMGKCGYVYQASNFTYIGKFKTSVYLDKNTGEKIHPRSCKELLKENAEFEGVKKVFWLTDDFCKARNIDKINGLMYRYIYPLNRKGWHILREYDEYLHNPNPKDDSLVFERRVSKGKFERIEKPTFNMNVFIYNYQKY